MKSYKATNLKDIENVGLYLVNIIFYIYSDLRYFLDGMDQITKVTQNNIGMYIKESSQKPLRLQTTIKLRLDMTIV